LQRRWGEGTRNPTEAELAAALDEMKQRDSEHPDCWLSDENGWTLTIHEDQQIVLENVESGEGPWHQKNQTTDTVLALWRLLQAGDIAALRNYEWLVGYE